MPSLEALLASDHEVAAAVTNPDRAAGRGMELHPSPVKVAAEAAGLVISQPASARDPDLHDALRALAPDCCVVVAYGKILPASLLRIPPKGFVNVHFSLLPAYRGAAPVQRAIMDGVAETGVSIMVLTEGMDEGPVLAAEAVPVEPDESAGSVGERLAERGARLLIEALEGYASGTLVPAPQDDARATYAPKIGSEEARIDWTLTTRRIRDFVRGLDPVPGAWTTFGDRRLRVFRVSEHPADLAPGEVAVDREVVVGTGDGAAALEEVQPAGKRRMSGAEFARGLRVDPRVRMT